MNYIKMLFFLLVTSACVDQYNFNINNQTEGLVIEASISDKSFSDTRLYPSDGRYFKVSLKKTSSVDNIRDVVVSSAKVSIVDDQGQVWYYIENELNRGNYDLRNPFFKADPARKYKLKIQLADGKEFESGYEGISDSYNEMGTTEMEEVIKQEYQYTHSDGRIITDYAGINLKIKIPSNSSKQTRFFRWTFTPLFLYTATHPRGLKNTCWVTSEQVLNRYVLHQDMNGGYTKDLFFLKTKGNEQVYQYFSTLIIQEQSNEAYYNFWKDLQAQEEKGGLYDQPPFGLSTNYKALNNDWSVNGYFGVVSENAIRWTFDPKELSYGIENNLEYLCSLPFGPPIPGEPDECHDCRGYSKGDATLTPPLWW